MNGRVLDSIIWVAAAASATFSGSMAHTTERKCYANLDQFMIAKFGEDYKMDENISHKVASGALLMVTDKTAETNPSRYFLLPEVENNKICLVLDAPIALEVKFEQYQSGNFPKTIKTKSGGQGPDIDISYAWRKQSKKYLPAKCSSTHNDKTMAISCKSALAPFGK